MAVDVFFEKEPKIVIRRRPIIGVLVTTTVRLIYGENTCTIFEFPTAITMRALSGVGAGHYRRAKQRRTMSGKWVIACS
jgi:hypothetical protein